MLAGTASSLLFNLCDPSVETVENLMDVVTAVGKLILCYCLSTIWLGKGLKFELTVLSVVVCSS